MRRQRVVRASSAQSLCVFCACRFGLEPGIARIPRRNIASTIARPLGQSAVLNGSTSASSASPNSSFTFDPNSYLTANEQEEKWRRVSAERKLAEDRQRIEIKQQQAKQQAIWEADEKRIKAVAADAEKSRPTEEGDKRSNVGQVDVGRRKRSNGEQSSYFRSALVMPASTGQPPEQAMISSRPPRGDRNIRARDRSQQKEPSSSTSRRRDENQAGKAAGKNSASGSGFTFRKFELPSREDGKPSQAARTSHQNTSRHNRDSQHRKPERVAMPDFLLPNHSSGPAAPPTTGWGAKATDVKPLEHGDVSSNVKDIDDVQSNVQNVRDLQTDDGTNAQEGQVSGERTSQSERRLNFGRRLEESASPGRDLSIKEEGNVSTAVQKSRHAHASTLDTFGYYEDEITSDAPTQQDAPSAASGPDLTHVPSHKSNVVAEAAVQAATMGGFGQSFAEEPSQSELANTDPALASQDAPAEPKTATSRSLETSRNATSAASTTTAPFSPAAAPIEANMEQQAEPPRSADMPPPVLAASPPVSSHSTQMSPEQAMMEKIEQMRRMVDDFDRMKIPRAAPELPPSAEQKSKQSRPYGQGIPPTTPTNTTPTVYQNATSPAVQHHLSDTGYRATPFNPNEMSEPFRKSAVDDGKWGLLRRRQDTKTTPSAPPAQVPTTQPRSQPRRQTSKVSEQDADKLFEAHRASRTSYAPLSSTENESYVFDRTFPDQDVSTRKCARCGQMGHTAMMCQGRRAPVCHNCGKEGHVVRDCTMPRSRRGEFTIFVGGISQDTTNADFEQFSRAHEGVVGIRLITEPSYDPGMPSRCRGFGFVSFGSEQARERFLAKGPFTLLGKSLTVQHDQGPTRERASQSQSAASDGRADHRRVANPSGEAAGGGNVIRRTSRDNSFAPMGSFDPSPPQQGEAASRFLKYEKEDSIENRRGFKQAEASPVPIEESKRGVREARRRQWEEPEVEVEKSDKGAERKGRRGSRREMEEDEEEERGGAREAHRARKVARQKQKDAEKEAEKQAAKRKRDMKKKEEGTPINLPEFISIQHLSQALGVRYEAFVDRLEELGYDDVFAGKTLDSETSGMIAMEYNFDPTFDGGYREEEVRDLKARPPLLDRDSLPARPPVVTIMGHVDHGKTTLLDYLRKSSVAAGEAGGITQHIGAFSVPLAASGKTVTFLDTPGHAAFLAMRQRGANVTDMVILVVAADDSVKPQTLEAIRHATEAGVPMIVALNKVDKPEADVERCKQDLARHGVEIEDYGGEVQVVEVSGKTGTGMDALEENIVALSELLDHRAETDGAVEGWVLEASTRKAGRVATVLVRRGTLAPGAVIVAGRTWARVRTLKNEAGVEIENGGPGMPCEVDGWRDQPSAGDEVLEAPTEQKASSVVEYRNELVEREQTKRDMDIINTNRKLEQEKREKEKAAEQAAKRAATATVTLGPDGTPLPAPVAGTAPTPNAESQESSQITVPFIIKADVSGSAEAVAAYILSLSSPLIAPKILASEVGPVHESDIELASAAEGHIIAFNLPNDPEAMGRATARGVKILANDIIYRCLDDVKAVLEDKLPPIVSSRVTGEAEISAVFEIGVGGRKKVSIAGVKVRNGSVARNARARVMRDGEKVYDGTINSLKNQKKDADVMRKGSECGMGFEDWGGFQAGDQVQVYEEISEKRRL